MDHRDEPRNTHRSRRHERLRSQDVASTPVRLGTPSKNTEAHMRHLPSAPRSSFWYACFALFVTAHRRGERLGPRFGHRSVCNGEVSLTIENGTVWVSRSMTNSTDSSSTPDPIDEESAEIDARSPNAEERIEELVEHAKELGRDAKVHGE